MSVFRTVSHEGHELARSFEALRLRTYDDKTGKPMQPGQRALGVPTIGWGNTRRALPVRNITADEAEAYYDEDVHEALATIYRHVPTHIIESLPQACYDALFSFIFNVGEQAFGTPSKRTNFYKTLMTDLSGVGAQMMRWVYDGGVKVAGLIRRRKAESTLWDSGLALPKTAPASTVPTAIVEGTNRVPDMPQPAISQGPMMQRPSTGAATTAVGAAGAVVTETATQMSLLDNGSEVIKLICLVLVLAGLGLTVWALVKQNKAGRA